MWAFFAALFGAGYLGHQYVKEQRQIAQTQQYVQQIKQQAVKAGAPSCGLWCGMIHSYPDPETGKWDQRTWCYQDAGTKEFYTNFKFTTSTEGAAGMTEACRYHESMKRINPALYH